MKIRDSAGKVWDTDFLNLSEMESLYSDVLEAKLAIQANIEKRVAEAKTQGEKVDRVWAASARSALRYKNQYELFLRQEISHRRKEDRRKEDATSSGESRKDKDAWRQSLGHHFISVVQEWADEKTYDACMKEAKRRAELSVCLVDTDRGVDK